MYVMYTHTYNYIYIYIYIYLYIYIYKENNAIASILMYESVVHRSSRLIKLPYRP